MPCIFVISMVFSGCSSLSDNTEFLHKKYHWVLYKTPETLIGKDIFSVDRKV